MKQKKKNKVNNKFDFDNDFFIGISSNDAKTVKEKKKDPSKAKKKTKMVKKNKKSKSTYNGAKTPKKTVKLRFKIIVLSLILVVSICFLLLSPLFNLKEIIVDDNNRFSDDELISLSQIELNKNVFLTNKGEARDNIESNPYIDSVKIKIVFPNKLKLIVSERKARFIIELGEGVYSYIDKNGYVLEFSNEKPELPIIVGFSTELGEMVDNLDNQSRINDSDLKKLDMVLKIMNSAENHDLVNLISKVDVSDTNDYKLFLDSEGKIVHLGKCNDLNACIMYTKAIIDTEKGVNGEVFVNMNLNEKSPFFRESI